MGATKTLLVTPSLYPMTIKAAFMASLVLLTAFALASCGNTNQDDTASNEQNHVPVTVLASYDIDLKQEIVADIQAQQNIEIRARVDGFLETIHVDEGQTVQKGQLLFSLADQEYRVAVVRNQADLANAKAEVEGAQIELERVKDLVDKKVVSPTEQKLAKAKLDAALAKMSSNQAELEKAQIKLEFTKIRAPFDGIVDRLPLKRGSLIKEGTELTTLSDISKVFAYFYLTERQYLNFAKGKVGLQIDQKDTVELVLADGAVYPQAGKIEAMQGQFDEATGSLSFRARFPNQAKLLKHGATGKVRFANHLDQAVLVPQKATFEVQDKIFVFLVDSAGILKVRSFEPQARYQDFYVVKTGLQAGDRVVYEGFQSLKEGDKVQPQLITLKPKA